MSFIDSKTLNPLYLERWMPRSHTYSLTKRMKNGEMEEPKTNRKRKESTTTENNYSYGYWYATRKRYSSTLFFQNFFLWLRLRFRLLSGAYHPYQSKVCIRYATNEKCLILNRLTLSWSGICNRVSHIETQSKYECDEKNPQIIYTPHKKTHKLRKILRILSTFRLHRIWICVSNAIIWINQPLTVQYTHFVHFFSFLL